MRTIYINPEGIKFQRKPKVITIDNVQYIPPTDAQLISVGWKIEEIIDPIPKTYVPTYEERVVMLIRQKYSLDDELSIQRQRESKPKQFAEYYAYCEECKEKAKEE